MRAFTFSLTVLAFTGSLAQAQVATPAPTKLPASVTVPVAPAPDAVPNSRVTAILTSTPMIDTPANCGTLACETNACCPRYYIGAEYLYWMVQGQPLPPLVSTSPDGTPRNEAGVLGTPGARTLFGGSRVNDDFRSGLRLRAGFWFDDNQQCGLEADYFYLGDSNTGGTFGSPGSPIISRPFTNALGGQASQLVAFPGVLTGSVTVNAGNEVYGAGVLFRRNLCCNCCDYVDLLVGYRYLSLTDDVTITESLTNTGQAAVPLGTGIVVRDHFRTENTFNGAVLGLAGMHRSGHFYLEGRASIALGNVHEVTSIDGTTTVTVPGGVPVVNRGGLLAQGTNIGTYTRDVFAVVPEVGVKAGVQATRNLRVFVGYNWLLLSRVARAGDQIDTVVNPAQIPPAGVFVGPARPAFPNQQSSVWIQGISLGAELRF